MTILVIAEHDNSSLKPATLNTLTAAQQLGGAITLLVAGSNCSAAAQMAAQVAGVSKVLIADAPHLADQLAENLAAQILGFRRIAERLAGAPAKSMFGAGADTLIALVAVLVLFAFARFLYRRQLFLRV